MADRGRRSRLPLRPTCIQAEALPAGNGRGGGGSYIKTWGGNFTRSSYSMAQDI